MKILLVITKAEIGGAQVFVKNLAYYFHINRYNVDVAAGDGSYLPEELEKIGITFHYLKSLKRDYNIINSLSFIYQLRKLLIKNKYDIIHLNSTNTLLGILSTFFLPIKPKIVFTIHGLSFLDKNYGKNKLIKFITKLSFNLLLAFVNRNIFVSQKNYEEFKKISNGSVILNGLDDEKLEYFNKSQAREYLSNIVNYNLSDSFIVGSTGRLSYQKNYEFLISNFISLKKKIPSLKMILIGDGPNYVLFTKLIKDLNIQNDFFLLGEIKDSYKYIKAFDVFTLPSRYEGLSISLIEAIFSEVPILATNVGGNPEIVGNDKRQIFTLNDEKDYLEKLITLSQEKSLIVKNNIKLKSNFTLNKMAEEYIKIYKELINNK